MILSNMIWFDMIWYYLIWFDMIWHMIWHGIMLSNMIWCDNSLQYDNMKSIFRPKGGGLSWLTIFLFFFIFSQVNPQVNPLPGQHIAHSLLLLHQHFLPPQLYQPSILHSSPLHHLHSIQQKYRLFHLHSIQLVCHLLLLLRLLPFNLFRPIHHSYLVSPHRKYWFFKYLRLRKNRAHHLLIFWNLLSLSLCLFSLFLSHHINFFSFCLPWLCLFH